jgi:lipopolysaccharide/colanic/teichoic acid biosynthesis glycosyltransferase
MYKLLKRLLDLLIAGVTFIIFLPLFIPIVIGQKLTGEGYVFYFQKRIGYKNIYFHIWKFATMLIDSPNLGAGSITLRNDSRVTPMGNFLRPTKLNEFPQVINVLKGDLSIVGPRPLVDKTFNAYSKEVREVIYNVKPGITGIGSIVFRDEETLISDSDEDPHVFYKRVIAPYKGALELWYQKNASLYTDILIIFLTAWAIIFKNTQLHYKIFKDLPQRTF